MEVRAPQRVWQPRSPERMSEQAWTETLTRVRGEFDEMRCMRLTAEQACGLLGLPETAASRVLERLESDGFLSRTAQGEFVRRTETR